MTKMMTSNVYEMISEDYYIKRQNDDILTQMY